MKTLIILIAAILISTNTYADLTDCQDIYVGRIRVENGSGGISKAVFLNDPSSGSGSYWVSFSSWSPDEKKAALSILMAAKFSKHKLNLKTNAADGCGIENSGQAASRVDLATQP